MLKGNFQKKNKVADAPDLLMVVNARPEMKERATAEAKARQMKMEEQTIKKMRAKVVVSKPPPKQAKAEWTNVLKPSKKMSQKIMHVSSSPKMGGANGRKKSKKPTARSAESVGGFQGESNNGATDSAGLASSSDTNGGGPVDWNAVYQDIVSPTSGNHKFVAKQDLAAPEKVTSPKKKARGKKSRSSFPVALPLDVGHSNHSSANERSGYESGDTMSRDSSVMDPVDDDRMHPVETSTTELALPPSKDPTAVAALPTLVSPPSKDDQDPYHLTGEVAAPPVAPPASGGDDFVDLSEYQDQSEKTLDEAEELVAVEFGDTLPSDTLNDIDMNSDDPQHQEVVAVTPPQHKKQQLILEFTVPGLTGYGGPGDGGYGDGDNDVGLEVPVEILSFDDMSSVDSWPSIDSDDSYDTKMNKMMQRWVDVNGGYDDHRGMSYSAMNHQENAVNLDDNVLDHIVLAAPDLEKAMEQFEQMTGIMPTHVGPLQGLGAKTAHVGLDNNRYIEILAPDLESPGPLGDELKTLEEGTLAPYHYSIRSSEVSRLIEGYVYDVLGWDPDHIAMVQALPDNSIRQWDLLTMYGHDMGGCAPYYVRWNDPAHHPTASIPLNAILVACTVRAPENHDVHKLITGVGGINVEFGNPLLECTLSTPKGTLTFSSSRPKGLVFPGYDDEHDMDEPMPDLLLGSEADDTGYGPYAGGDESEPIHQV